MKKEATNAQINSTVMSAKSLFLQPKYKIKYCTIEAKRAAQLNGPTGTVLADQQPEVKRQQEIKKQEKQRLKQLSEMKAQKQAEKETKDKVRDALSATNAIAAIPGDTKPATKK